MAKQETKVVDEVLEQKQLPFFKHFNAFLSSDLFAPGKKYGDWVCIETDKGFKGMETANTQFSLITQVIQLAPGVILVNSGMSDTIHSMVFRDSNSEAVAQSFLQKINAELSQENTGKINTPERISVDSFILKMFVEKLDQLLQSYT